MLGIANVVRVASCDEWQTVRLNEAEECLNCTGKSHTLPDVNQRAFRILQKLNQSVHFVYLQECRAIPDRDGYSWPKRAHVPRGTGCRSAQLPSPHTW